MRYGVPGESEYPTPPVYPCDVLDADGKIIDLEVIEFDDESGEVIFHIKDENGRVKTALYPPKGVEGSPISIEDCPSITHKDPDGRTRVIKAKPMDKRDWEEKVVTEKKVFKAPLTIIPYEAPSAVGA